MGNDHNNPQSLNYDSDESFYTQYRNTFSLVKADTPEALEQCFKLRYDVYCLENGFINPAFHHGKMECDIHDTAAEHFLLIHNETGKTAGTSRVIMVDPYDEEHNKLPLQPICNHPILEDKSWQRRAVQISRFCMHKDFRRREDDGELLPSYTQPENLTGTHNEEMVYIRRRIPYAPLGLFMAAFETALSRGASDCVMNIKPSQLQAFNKMGLSYHTLGPQISHLNGMQPVVFNIKNLLDTMLIDNPPCWDIVSDMGRIHKIANNQYLNDWQDQVIETLDWDKILEIGT